MSVTCRRAKDTDRTAVKALWRLSFPEDTERDIDRFLDTFPPAEKAYVLCEADAVQTMLFLLPVTIENAQARYDAGYIYAGATHPASRGKGYYKRLLSYAEKCAKADGLAALMLRPATRELAYTYRCMGFVQTMLGTERVLTAEDVSDTTPLSASEYRIRRQQILRERGQAFVDWDERTVLYASDWCEARRAPNGQHLWLSRDSRMVWESLPPNTDDLLAAALLKPLTDMDVMTEPIWFGYGLM